MSQYTEHEFRTRDGLRLYYRDFPGDAQLAPVLCLAGLTRNCMDFEALAQRIAPRRRVITPDQRGRGRSQYDSNWLNYHPGKYVEDMWDLLQALAIEQVVVIGTSLGGLMAMLMASVKPQQLAGVVLNDIGPDLDIAGMRRIQQYVGRLPPVVTWEDAVAQMQMVFGPAFPDYDAARWLHFARLSFLTAPDGMPLPASDPRIGELVRAAPPGPSPGLWLAYEGLRQVPTLAIRGELSDLLSSETFERMAQIKPDLRRVTVAGRGHPPLLDEPECARALDEFLSELE